MNDENLPLETTHNIPGDRVRLGLLTSVIGLVIFLFGAKPEWLGLSLTPIVGFVQITVFLIGLAVLCLGGYLGLAALWGGREKSIVADIGSRLIGTGYVICVFSGLADVFGMSVKDNPKVPFFGPWQAAGVELGMLIIVIGVLMIIPRRNLKL